MIFAIVAGLVIVAAALFFFGLVKGLGVGLVAAGVLVAAVYLQTANTVSPVMAPPAFSGPGALTTSAPEVPVLEGGERPSAAFERERESLRETFGGPSRD